MGFKALEDAMIFDLFNAARKGDVKVGFFMVVLDVLKMSYLGIIYNVSCDPSFVNEA